MRSAPKFKQWLIGSLAVFLIHTLFGFFVTRVVYPPSALLGGGAAAFHDPTLSRLFIHLSRLIFSMGFTLVFLRMSEGRVKISKGIQFGLIMAVLLDIPAFFSDLVRTTLDVQVILALCSVGILEALVLGVVLSMTSALVPSNKQKDAIPDLKMPRPTSGRPPLRKATVLADRVSSNP